MSDPQVEQHQDEQHIEDEVAKALATLDDDILVLWAKTKGIFPAQPYNKEEIIERLLNAHRGQLQDELRNVVRLELNAATQRWKESLADESGGLKESYEKRITEKLQSVEALRNIWVIVTGTISLFFLLGFLRFNDLDAKVKTADTLKNDLRSVVDIHRSYIVDQVQGDLREVMAEFSTTTQSPDLAAKMKKNGDLIHKIQALPQESIDNPSNEKLTATRLLGFLERFYTNLQTFENVKGAIIRNPTREDIDILRTKLDDAGGQWETLGADLDKFQDDEKYGSDVKLYRAYVWNMEGNIKLIMLEYVNPKLKGNLKEADKCFQKANKLAENFSRPYSNRAVIAFRQLKNAKPQDRTNLIDEGLDDLHLAESHSETTQVASVYLNNEANFYVNQAQLYEKEQRRDLAAIEIEKAINAVTEAKEKQNAHPVVYISEAEIQCYQLHLNGVGKLSASEKKHRFEDVIELIDLGAQLGYKMTKDQVEEDDFFRYLAFLDTNYKPALLRALRLK